MRSASIPQNCRLMNAQASSTDSIAAPCVGAMPRSVQNATRCPFGTAIGMQQKNAAMQISASARLGGMPSTGCALARIAGQRVHGQRLRRRAQAQQGQRQDHREHHGGVGQHRRLPAVQRDAALEHRRPDDAGDVLARRDQRQRGAAAAVEPAADVDHQRRIDRAVADQADQQPVPDIQRPDAAGRRTAPGPPPSSPRR